MEPTQTRELSFPTARRLAELGALIADFSYVLEATNRLLELLTQEKPDGVLSRALYTAALVTYARGFADGKRWKLDVSVVQQFEDDAAGAAGAHDYFILTRNKHIAHSVNAFEEYRAAAVLSADGPEVIGVGYLSYTRLNDASEGVQQLRLLTTAALKHLSGVFDVLQAEVLKEAQALGAGEVASLPLLRMTPPGGAEAARSTRTS